MPYSSKHTLLACLGLFMMFIAVGLPIIGIVLAESTTWNVVWWIVYSLWALFLMSRPLTGFYFLATFAVQLPAVLMMEAIPGKLGVLAFIWAAWFLLIYRGLVPQVAKNFAEKENAA